MSSSREHPVLHNRHILVVDDDASLLELWTLVLEEAGAHVRAVTTPEDALVLAKSWNVHVLLTDVVLPGCSGIQLAADMARIRPAIRVLLVSGYGDPEIGARELMVPHDALTKPLMPDELVQHVQALLIR